MKKRGQMKLSFGMIFSIFLVIVFLSFSVYAIIKFINMQQAIQIELFKDNLQAHITAIWLSHGEYSEEKKYYLPKKINAVCFTNDDSDNLYFESDDFLERMNIDHIEIEEDFCIGNIDGKVSMTLVKEDRETLVKIIR